MRRLFILMLFFVVALGTPASGASFGVAMRGSNEVPAGDSNGMGFADLILEGRTLRYSVVVFNIEAPTAMHIHPGRRGETGPPVIPFTTPFVRHEGCPSLGADACTERFVNVGQLEITAEQAAALLEQPSTFYLNVHNVPHAPGAVRGQVQNAYYIPIVGQTPGAAGSQWFTRLAALNRSFQDTSEWTMEFLPQSPAGNTDRFVIPQTAAAPLNLFFSSDFPVPGFSGIGSMRILSDQPMHITASIYNGSVGLRGDYGFSVPGMKLEDAETSGLLVDLTTSSSEDILAARGHRSNIGYFNPQVEPVQATFRAYGKDGVSLGQTDLLIPPGAMSQAALFDLIESVHENELVFDSFWVSWVSSAPIFVYATVVNNDTGDAELRD